MAYSVKGKGKHISRMRRHQRMRKHIFGPVERPRLVVIRSNRHMTVQPVNDYVGKTLVSAPTMGDILRIPPDRKAGKAYEVGRLTAQCAKVVGITVVIFNCGDNKYHGRVTAVAEGTHEDGLSLQRKQREWLNKNSKLQVKPLQTILTESVGNVAGVAVSVKTVVTTVAAILMTSTQSVQWLSAVLPRQ